MRKIGILILGTYRSGTSALTGVLHHLGFNSGYDGKIEEGIIFSPTGSYNDDYFSKFGTFVNWMDYYASKNKYEKWICKHHILLQHDLAKQFSENFPTDREKWLIMTDRKIENSIESMRNKTNSDYTIGIKNQKQICNNIYNSWDGQKLIVNFRDLINDTENTVKNLCTNLQVEYTPVAIEIVNKELSKFGE